MYNLIKKMQKERMVHIEELTQAQIDEKVANNQITISLPPLLSNFWQATTSIAEEPSEINELSYQ